MITSSSIPSKDRTVVATMFEMPKQQAWHPVAVALSGVILVAILLANLPASVVVEPDVMRVWKVSDGPEFLCNRNDLRMVHGWPWAFLNHRNDSPHLYGYPSPWEIGRDVNFHVVPLMGNVAMAILVVLMPGWYLNRRTKTLGWQISIREVLILTALIAVCTISVVEQRRKSRVQREFVIAQGTDGFWQPFGPHWLRRLTGPSCWKWGDELVAVAVREPIELDSIPYKESIKVLYISHRLRSERTPCMDGFSNLLAMNLMLSSNVRDDSISPQFVTAIARCESLQGLNMVDCGLRNADLKTLSQLPNLKHLDVQYNYELDDACIPDLVTMSSLRRLNVGNIMTPNGIQELRRKMPQCCIIGRGYVPPSPGEDPFAN